MWYVLIVRILHERSIESLLVERRGVDAFVPCRSEVRQYRNRRRVKWYPLLSGYVFVSGILEEIGPLVTLPGVISFLRVNGMPACVTPSEIEAVRRIAEQPIGVETWHELTQGKRIKILSGPLMGCEGEIVERKNRRFFTVRINVLGRQIAIPIDPSETATSLF